MDRTQETSGCNLRNFNGFLLAIIFLSLSLNSKSSWAQMGETPPQEAPYVEEDEFSPPDAELSEIDTKASSSSGESENEILAEIPEDAPVDVKPAEPKIDSDETKVKLGASPSKSDGSEDSQLIGPEKKWTLDHSNQIRSGRKFINHPLAKKGLLAITKDGHYIYETNESRDYNHTGTLRYATMDSPNINAADGTSFSTMYGGGPQSILMFDYEWQPFTKFGKLGFQSGIGFIFANGQGRFDTADPALKAQEAKEKYTFLAIPLSFGVIYRLEWLKRQWFAPYASGGLNYFPVIEFRDDSKTPSAVGTAGAYGAGGVMLNVSALDRDTAFILTSEYGISNLWVSLEYRLIQTFNSDLDFSSNVVSAGIAVDY